jgi:predicted nucleic acid-binding protein
MKYMLDTVIFNKILDGLLPIEKLPSDGKHVATHLQIDELSATKDISRRTQLLSQFEALSPERAVTASFAFDISRFDQSKCGDGVFFKILKDALHTANGGKRNNTHDALIGETSVANGFTLLTCDFDLAEAVRQQGGLVVSFKV